jgi:predicted flap endonuclease-1-like 5' DNA nuclease
MNTEIKEIIAITLLVLGILQGMNTVVSEERTMDGILRTVLLLGAALLVYLWMMRDQRSARDAAEETLDEVEKQLDVVKEAVKDAKEQAEERVETGLDYIVDDTPDKPTPPATPIEQPKSAPAIGVPGEEANFSAIDDLEGIPPPPPRGKAVTITVDDDTTEPEPVSSTAATGDDLTIIEGIGPSFRDMLVRGGVDTFAKLAAMSADDIVQVIRANGGRKSASMTTWAQQAKLAAAGDWAGLATLKQQLRRGSQS